MDSLNRQKTTDIKSVVSKAPRAGFEPATNRLTVDRSTAELPRIERSEPSPHTLLTASVFKSSISKSPDCHGPIRPFSILAAPSQC